MGSQQYCLRWNNHQSSVMSVFSKLLSNESLVDVTLACEGAKLKAHRVVLSACSPYFQEIFEDNPCQHPVVILKDFTFAELRSLIDFIYKGEVNINQQCLDSFLKTAESLQISGLANVSTEDQTAAISQTSPAATSYASTSRGGRITRSGRLTATASSSSSHDAVELPSVTSLCEVTVDDGEEPQPNYCSEVIRLDEALRGDVHQIPAEVDTVVPVRRQQPARGDVGRPGTRSRVELAVDGAGGGGGGGGRSTSLSSSAPGGSSECMIQEVMLEPSAMVKEEIEIVDDEVDFGVDDLDSNFSRATDNQDSIHGEMVDQSLECPETMIEAVPPENVWSFIEISLSDDPESEDVIFIKGSEDAGSTADRVNSSITVVECRNAVGRVLSPFVVYRSIAGAEPWWTLGYDQATYGASPSGWLEKPTFDRWFADILHPVLAEQPGPKLLVANYSPDYVSDDVSERCAATDTDFVAEPITAHGLIRPFVGQFAELYLSAWRKILSAWRNSEEGRRLIKLPKSRFPSLLRRLRCSLPLPPERPTPINLLRDIELSNLRRRENRKRKRKQMAEEKDLTCSDSSSARVETYSPSSEQSRFRRSERNSRPVVGADNVPGPSTSSAAADQLLPELRRRILSPDTRVRMKLLKIQANPIPKSHHSDESHVPKKTKTRRRCAHCAIKNLDKRSDINCSICDVALCKSCFDPYHQLRAANER